MGYYAPTYTPHRRRTWLPPWLCLSRPCPSPSYSYYSRQQYDSRPYYYPSSGYAYQYPAAYARPPVYAAPAASSSVGTGWGKKPPPVWDPGESTKGAYAPRRQVRFGGVSVRQFT